MVHRHQVIVHGLRNPDEPLRNAVRGGPFGKGVHRVHGIVAADVEHHLNIVGVHHFHQALVIGVVAALQLVAARSQRRRRGLLQNLHLAGRQVGEVVEFVLQHALDAVDAAENAVVHGVQLVGANDAGEAGVDNGGRPAGLGNKAIGHGNLLRSRFAPAISGGAAD